MNHTLIIGPPRTGRSTIAEGIIRAFAADRQRFDVDPHSSQTLITAALIGASLLVLDDNLREVATQSREVIEQFVSQGGVIIAMERQNGIQTVEVADLIAWLQDHGGVRLIQVGWPGDIEFAEPVSLPVGPGVVAHLAASNYPGNVVRAARHVLGELSLQAALATAPMSEKAEFAKKLGTLDAAIGLAARHYPKAGYSATIRTDEYKDNDYDRRHITR